MTLSPEISVKCDRSRRTCVLDPMLALSAYGIPLVKQLGTVMDLWVGKEFCHLLDNVQFYVQHPELLLLNRVITNNTSYIATSSPSEIVQSLQEWAKFRQEMDLGSLKLFWVGDRWNESSLPPGITPDIIRHYEALTHALYDRLPRSPAASETLKTLSIDTIALAATLNSAFILTRQHLTMDPDVLLPDICLELESFGIPCQLLQLDDEMVAIEQNYLRQIFVRVGLSKFLWAGMKLGVLHLLVPSASQLGIAVDQYSGLPIISDSSAAQSNRSDLDLWADTQCFWYQFQ
jgi:hypothetical protein